MGATEWSGRDWRITVNDMEMTVDQGSASITVPATEASRFEVRRSWFKWSFHDRGRSLLRLRGISKSDASSLALALRRLVLTPAIADAVAWHASIVHLLDWASTEQRWIPTETVGAVLAKRPEPRLLQRVRAAECEPSLTRTQLEAVISLDTDMEKVVADTNEQIVAAELSSRRRFFDTIEKTPLTDEQARAVVCFDNRVQVLAAAGSGKTSVMVARAAYAVSRGFLAPDRVLLLAFNRTAAAELQERVMTRFAAVGIDSSGMRASTFHSFGLDVIGRATGEKPRLASWLEEGGDVRMILQIVDELRDASEGFRYRWDLYRTVLANAPTRLEEDEPDGYDRTTGKTGYRTFAGEVVRSHGERTIADFLYLNGVDYVYERPYRFPVADATHAQYRPDFYYPGIDVWHEHWALDRDGKAPAAFIGYAEAMSWKRRAHARYRTTLVETTWDEVMFGDGLSKLKDELNSARASVRLEPRSPTKGRLGKADEARRPCAPRPDVHDPRQVELVDG